MSWVGVLAHGKISIGYQICRLANLVITELCIHVHGKANDMILTCAYSLMQHTRSLFLGSRIH